MSAARLVIVGIADQNDRAERRWLAVDDALGENSLGAAANGAKCGELLDVIRHREQAADITEFFSPVIHVQAVDDDMFSAVGEFLDQSQYRFIEKLHFIECDDIRIGRFFINPGKKLVRQMPWNGNGRKTVADPADNFILGVTLIFRLLIGNQLFPSILHEFLASADQFTRFFAKHGARDYGNPSFIHLYAPFPLKNQVFSSLDEKSRKIAAFIEYHNPLGVAIDIWDAGVSPAESGKVKEISTCAHGGMSR